MILLALSTSSVFSYWRALRRAPADSSCRFAGRRSTEETVLALRERKREGGALAGREGSRVSMLYLFIRQELGLVVVLIFLLGSELLQRGSLDSLLSGESDLGLFVSDDENVDKTGGESLAGGVGAGDDVDLSWLGDNVGHGSNTTLIVTVGQEAGITQLALVDGVDLSGLEVEGDGIADLDLGVDEPKGSRVVSDGVRDLVGSDELLDDLAELELMSDGCLRWTAFP